MKKYNFEKKITNKTKRINLELPPDMPLGKVKLTLIVTPEKEEKQSSKGDIDKILKSKLIGLWKNRKDIGDSVEYARKLRQQAELRG